MVVLCKQFVPFAIVAAVTVALLVLYFELITASIDRYDGVAHWQ